MEKIEKPNAVDSSSYVLVILAFLSYTALNVLTYYNYANVSSSIFYQNFTAVYSKYITELTPNPTFRFATSVICALWVTAALAYFIAGLFLPPNQSPVKFTYTLAPKAFLISFTVSCTAIIGWLFVFDREQLILSFMFLIAACCSLWKCVREIVVLVHDLEPAIESSSPTMLWLMRGLVINGLTFYAATLTGDCIVGLATIMIYQESFGQTPPALKGGFTVVDGSTTALVAFLVIIFLFFIVESVAYEEYFRFIISDFIGLLLYFAAVVYRLRQTGNDGQNFIIAVSALSICGAWSIYRIVVFVFQIIGSRAKVRLYSLENSDKSLVGQI